MEEIIKAVQTAVKELFNIEIEPDLTRPDEQFGDYASNIALQLAAKVDDQPRKIAEAIANKLRSNQAIRDVDIAGPGFINLRLTDEALSELAFESKLKQPLKGQEILVEFGDPNPFKEMHIGHLYSYIVGDIICSLLESAGAKVRRLSYHGDIGRHVARAIYGMKQEEAEPADPAWIERIKTRVGYYYALGVKADTESKTAKHEIDSINEHIYKQDDASINALYKLGRQQSFAYFDAILEELDIKTDKNGRYLESQSAPIGVEIVQQNIGKVFSKSEGAIVFEGEKIGLHTRVFITSKGLPTYETKDLGLTQLKQRDYPDANQSIIITANEQAEYFKVMLAALKEINARLADKTKHISHGFVNLSSGKMSSRTGDVYGAASLIMDVKEAYKKLHNQTDQAVEIGAIKYEFTKPRLGGDITYDVNEAVSLEGNSGPYLQYAHARAQSILAKAGQVAEVSSSQFETGERSLVRKISEYPEVVSQAIAELKPHYICTYLYELAQTFNRFYENNRVIGDQREKLRLKLVQTYAETLKNGLSLLNIPAPDKM